MSASIDDILTAAFRAALGFDPARDGLPPPEKLPWVSNTEHEEMVWLHDEGMTATEIAALLGRGASTVRKHLAEARNGPSNA